jgi:serine/threonine protein kinase
LGVVEITPGRQYLTVAEFLSDTKETSKAEVDSRVVHSGLGAIRAMWDSGLAHRDIKPANVLVRDGDVFVIDVAFGEVRPSPWRQAVDLANMMLTLSLRHPAEGVHQAAQAYFTDAEIAEACAATRGVTLPGELRDGLKAADRDLLAVHRSLVPEREPIRIQRWTLRRIGALAGAAMVALVGVWLAIQHIALVRTLL